MIRFKRLSLNLLNDWLVQQNLSTTHASYRLRLWRENRDNLAAIQDELIDYLDEAFEDALRRMRRGFEDDLSPYNDPTTDPAANYPALLHNNTLRGYLGEILAVIAVEHWGAHNYTDWVVPAMLFRFHDQEFQHLEIINERILNGETHDPNQPAEMRPGRTGDDGLAFRVDEENTIIDVLTLEAKCLTTNSNEKIRDAHQKLAAGTKRPSGIRELINLLEDYDTPLAQTWQKSLLKLWKGDYQNVTRYDGVGYAVGQIPIRGERIAWMPTDNPHPAYTVNRRLEGMEFQFTDLDSLLEILFRRTNDG